MPRGRKWSAHDLQRLRTLGTTGAPWTEVAEQFEGRTAGAVAQAWSKHFGDTDHPGGRGCKPWTTGELGRLRQMLECGVGESWAEVARRFPGRSASAVKQQAQKWVTPVGTHHMQRAGYMMRTYGPPPAWVGKLAEVVRRRFESTGCTRAAVARQAGVSEGAVGNLLTGRQTVKMRTYIDICAVLAMDPGAALSEAVSNVPGYRPATAEQ